MRFGISVLAAAAIMAISGCSQEAENAPEAAVDAAPSAVGDTAVPAPEIVPTEPAAVPELAPIDPTAEPQEPDLLPDGE